MELFSIIKLFIKYYVLVKSFYGWVINMKTEIVLQTLIAFKKTNNKIFCSHNLPAIGKEVFVQINMTVVILLMWDAKTVWNWIEHHSCVRKYSCK